MTQVPFASVATVRVNPVPVCVAVTVTPGSTPPLSSVTRPFSSAVACAQAGERVRRRTNAQTTTSWMVRLMTSRLSSVKGDRVESDYVMVSTLVASRTTVVAAIWYRPAW